MEDPGTYQVAEKYTVHIEQYSESLVRYDVRLNEKTIITSQDHASLGMRWYLYWDSKDRLWVMSSDIGTFVWSKDASGKYVQSDSRGHREWLKELPPKIQEDFSR